MMHPLDETALFNHLENPTRAFLLLLHTTHCSQCKIAHARLERVMQNALLEVDFFTCNLDVAPLVAEHFNIRSVPVCLSYDARGEQQRAEHGLKSEAVYESMALGVNVKKGNPKARLLGF